MVPRQCESGPGVHLLRRLLHCAQVGGRRSSATGPRLHRYVQQPRWKCGDVDHTSIQLGAASERVRETLDVDRVHRAYECDRFHHRDTTGRLLPQRLAQLRLEPGRRRSLWVLALEHHILLCASLLYPRTCVSRGLGYAAVAAAVAAAAIAAAVVDVLWFHVGDRFHVQL